MRKDEMKRIAKLVCFALLGTVGAVVVYSLLLGILEAMRSRSGGSPESYLPMAFSVAVPAALFLGSIFTGYLSRPHLQTRFGFIVVSPGLYLSLFMITVNVVMQYIVKDTSVPPAKNAVLLGIFLSWFLSSWAGVWLGYLIRSRRNEMRK
jgi:hypothetical protein